MNFKAFSRWNNIIGWLVFAIAAFTYLSTIEHTVSLWDCGEFVSCYYKLEVPHPPGAPLNTIVYRIATMLAGSNRELVPIMANATSALGSAFTILFLFWSITALAVKFMVKDESNMERWTVFAIFGAGAVGALAYTFSDTFWFSAVEGEVYAFSSMFTALVYWLALKWERRANEHHALRWLVLIFYMTGIVVGIHLLGLLVIPVVVLMYYFKKYSPATVKGTILAVLIGFAALGIVQIGVIQWLPTIGSWFELLFVNSFGLPFWSGVLFFFALVLGVCGYLIYWSHIHKKILLNTALLCFVSVIIGYSSYAGAIVRSFANPPIDMNDPEDVFSLIGYLSREQYGDSYLLTGPYYTAFKDQAYSVNNGATEYRMDKETHEYIETGHKLKYDFDERYTTFFPRMFNGSQGENYIVGYRYWGNVKNESKISFVRNNLRFFFAYQINYMYWRYFAWNFIGRQNDLQGEMNEFHRGNWLSGIPFIDEGIGGTGPYKGLPYFMKWNKGRNALYGLPFILGLLGLFFHYKKHRKDFWLVMLFFFMTGLAIEIYLNMPSPQPRERDYAFVGSFYVFAIWIGLGALYLFELFRRKLSPQVAAIGSTLVCLLAVPTLMAAREWDDHDRSGRTVSLDYGTNYLWSCAPNAVLFTNGDNDTYPLWCAQEVYGIRDDIRIVNLSLFGTDWYINEMRTPLIRPEPDHNAPGLTFSLTPKQTIGWDYGLYEQQNIPEPVEVDNFLKFIGSRTPEASVPLPTGEQIPLIPTHKFRITVDKAQVLKTGTVPADQADKIVDHIDFEVKKNYMAKSDIMLLDFISTNKWRLPIYFSITSGEDEYMHLGSFLQQEGLAYRLVPIKTNSAGEGNEKMNSDIMYDNIMKHFKWGMADKKEVLMDYFIERQAENLRNVLARLSSQLAKEGKNDKAVKIADKALEVFPNRNVPYNFFMYPFVETYFKVGETDKAKKLAKQLYGVFEEELSYYAACKPNQRRDVQREINMDMSGLNFLTSMGDQYNDKELSSKAKASYDRYAAIFPAPEQGGE